MSKQSECLRIRYILLGPGKNTDFLQEGKKTYRLLRRGYQSGRRTHKLPTLRTFGVSTTSVLNDGVSSTISNMASRHIIFRERHAALHERHIALIQKAQFCLNCCDVASNPTLISVADLICVKHVKHFDNIYSLNV